MKLREFLVRMLVFIQPLLPIALAVLVLTTLAVLCLAAFAKKLNLDQKRFRWLGLFYNLSLLDCIRVACSWLKFAMIIVYLVAFKSLTSADLMLVLLPGIAGAIRFHSTKKTVSNILWLVVESAAFISTNLVCGFIHTFNSGLGMLVIYVCMAIFTVLLAVFLFLTELGEISERRLAYAVEE